MKRFDIGLQRKVTREKECLEVEKVIPLEGILEIEKKMVSCDFTSDNVPFVTAVVT